MILSLIAAFPAVARDVVAGAPGDVSLTIYRDPYRDSGAMQLNDLGGFAVVSETRRVTLPAGRHRLRFVGVVDGIIPASAVMSGLPAGVVERNQDAALLSPSSLMRAARGKSIMLTRTDPATGKAMRLPAEIVSASEDGVVFHTKDGDEALRCSGYPETFRYGRDAEGLFAQPTLSVMVDVSRAMTVKVTLTYLAQGFDWNASYTARLNPAGTAFDLGGWITLANGNSVSLNNAQVQIVAGRLSRAMVDRIVDNAPAAIARCWPMEKTSDIPEKPDRPYVLVQPYLERPYRRWRQPDNDKGGIIVTAQRRTQMMQDTPTAVSAYSSEAIQEQLGDLKMYRIPRLTSVAAMQMKQTRLLERAGVSYERYYTARIYINPNKQPWFDQTVAMLRTRNDKKHSLGLPLPAGILLIDQFQFGRPMVLAEPELGDTAVDEKIELAIGAVSDVTVQSRCIDDKDRKYVMETTITNAGATEIQFELEIENGLDLKITNSTIAVIERDGKRLMLITIPAGGAVIAGYTGHYQYD
ncbi:MAG: hypothetical protein ABL914_00225 [Novosphingobium sp.]